MKNVIKNCGLIILLLSVSCFTFSQSKKELAARILSDKTLDTVYFKASVLLKKGFAAGDGYPQVWIRDLNSFIETSCDVYDTKIIRKNLLTFFNLQQPNNEIVDGFVLTGHVTWNDPNIYTSDWDKNHVGFKNTVETDQETSLIQAIGKYIEKTGDRSILNEKIAGFTVTDRLSLAIDYLLKNRYSEKYGLLTGATTQDWGDVQVEGGAVVDIDDKTHWSIDVYDNAMFVIALKYMVDFSGTSADRQKWEKMKDQVENNIRTYLWDKKNTKFIPHLYISGSPFPTDFNENEIHFHGGTAVAIEAGLLSKKEIAALDGRMVENVELSGAPSIGLTLYPPYPDGIIKGSNSSKPYIYQNGGDWTWFGGRMIQQLIAYGFVNEAYSEIRPMIDRVISNNKFYEWYDINGKPKGSGDFRGEAGVLAKSIKMLREWAQENK